MELSDAEGLVRKHGLEADSITLEPASDLYQKCVLNNPRDIRLVRLLPATLSGQDSTEEPLVAEMFTTSISSIKSDYEALSYVWGSNKTPKQITIIFLSSSKQASVFEYGITENLWRALCDLRLPEQPRVLWTDAICINQNDIPEKNVQVAQMRDVYVNSKQTLAHLGSPFDGLEALSAFRDCYETRIWWVGRPRAPDGQFMRFLPDHGIVRSNQTIPRISASLLSMVFPYFYMNYGLSFLMPKAWAKTLALAYAILNVGLTTQLLLSQNKFFTTKQPEVRYTPNEIVFGLAEFFVRPWFCRAWIVQECVVAPNVLFYIGREKFDIEDVTGMIWARCHFKNPIAEAAPASTHLLAFRRMVKMRSARSEGLPSPSLTELLQWSWNYGLAQEASNPRDKIFALLGLLDSWDPNFFVDYYADVEKVYWAYGRMLSQAADRFMLLEDPRRHDGLRMPSWVPDFSRYSEHSLYGLNDFYSASDGVSLDPYYLDENTTFLEVPAILVDKIDLVGRLYGSFALDLSQLHHPAFDNSKAHFEVLADAIPTLKSFLDLRDDIEEIFNQHTSLQIPSHLSKEAIAEVLSQVGIFFDQGAGSHNSSGNARLVQVEKDLGSEDSITLIERTVTAVHLARLYCQFVCSVISSDSLDDKDMIEADFCRLLEDLEQPGYSRAQRFRQLASHPNDYPFLSKQPFFQALSRDEWPPAILKDDPSIPQRISNNDGELFSHFTKTIMLSCGIGPWAERRIGKTEKGYICNAAPDTQIGDWIAVVAGCRMPLILRPLQDKGYRIVGHAYVMSLMNGEAAKLSEKTERVRLV